jgi:hypothetical protein
MSMLAQTGTHPAGANCELSGRCSYRPLDVVHSAPPGEAAVAKHTAIRRGTE